MKIPASCPLPRNDRRAAKSGTKLAFLFLGALCTFVPTRGLATPHAFSFDDLGRLAKVSDPQLSPDGKTLYFTVAKSRVDLNRWQSAIYVQEQSGAPQRLTYPEHGAKREGSDSSPRLSPDGHWLAFLSTRDSPAPQLHLLRIGGGEARRLTDLPSGVHGILWTPDSHAIVLQTRVHPECPPYPAGEECNKRRSEAHEHNPIKARVIDRLMYRWWDSWNDGQRSHLLRIALSNVIVLNDKKERT